MKHSLEDSNSQLSGWSPEQSSLVALARETAWRSRLDRVTYAGDPDHKKGVQATVHHHPGTTPPGALPGVK